MQKAIMVQGLAYGDEGKGATVDFLCRRLPVDLVVRFNGGSQAAHNIVTPEGVHHTFAQFGSGMLANNRVRTHLSRFMLVDPLTMMNEAVALQSRQLFVHGVWNRTTVDPRCVIITPFHKRINQLRETARGDTRHGSCGMGVGVAREWSLKHGDAVLYAGDLLDSSMTMDKLRFLRSLAEQEAGVDAVGYDNWDLHALGYEYSTWPVVLSTMPKAKLTVFEGAQGVLLDELHGEKDHNTWTDCTFANADMLCAEAGVADIVKIGCLRTYFTRHGAGSFPTETSSTAFPPELHNGTGRWQGEFRVGKFDYQLAIKALNIVRGVDCLSVSHFDRCTTDGDMVAALIESGTGFPIGIKANGPTADHRSFTEAWMNDTR